MCRRAGTPVADTGVNALTWASAQAVSRPRPIVWHGHVRDGEWTVKRATLPTVCGPGFENIRHRQVPISIE